MSRNELDLGLASMSGSCAESSAAPTHAQQATPGILRAGAGSPLFLLHGVTGSAHMWQRVLPLLSPHHDVIAPTALGHVGGPAAVRPGLQIRDVVDDAERCLDRLGFQRAHLAGNSMGGWVALELARRGRALSVCALSPAGVWSDEQRAYASRKLRLARDQSRSGLPLLPWLGLSKRFRRWALRDTAVHGDRVSREELLRLVSDMVECAVADDLLATTETLGPLQADCPVTLAWSGADRLFPPQRHRARAQELMPSARFLVLEDVGHVPMLDDAGLVARTILESTGARAEG
jgi:pimeloyl-ACP methyl ester carboxylesterase